jgi:hypothetical protein
MHPSPDLVNRVAFGDPLARNAQRSLPRARRVLSDPEIL